VELSRISLSKKLVKTICVEALRGKSFSRILMNHALSEIELSGNILDLGSGSDSASYNRFLKYKDPRNVTYSDYYIEGEGFMKINLEEPFVIQSKSFDYVLCFNTLEHIYNYKNVIKESYRILKKGGRFIGSTPFVHVFHPDPYDYFRYSHQALRRMFEDENYVCERMVYVGFGPFSLAVSHWLNLAPKLIRHILMLLAIFLDVLMNKFFKSNQVACPLCYVYIFSKS